MQETSYQKMADIPKERKYSELSLPHEKAWTKFFFWRHFRFFLVASVCAAEKWKQQARVELDKGREREIWKVQRRVHDVAQLSVV